jgi:hypothetical protein
MKKLSVILFICIYSLATMGFSRKEFYCCGKFKSVTIALNSTGNDSCSKGDNSHDGCCKNTYQYFKVKDSHITTAHVSNVVKHSISLPICHSSFLQDNYVSSQNHNIVYRGNAPPAQEHTVPDYIFNCIFRI